jgi:hypothetical protein
VLLCYVYIVFIVNRELREDVWRSGEGVGSTCSSDISSGLGPRRLEVVHQSSLVNTLAQSSMGSDQSLDWRDCTGYACL